MTVRTRFAPSPTGLLHIGGARTALFAWAYARKMHGTFILRIEDTDQERSTPESVAAILQGMDWLNLTYDEGPYYQTARFERYHAIAQKLLDEGKAYRCYCSKERIEALRGAQLARQEKPRYDATCRGCHNGDPNQPHVIRFANPTTGQVVVPDQVYGTITFDNAELDDLIILRSDGTPTYNFTVVVDDWDMKITHVIRGDDHINNTPRQINLLNALDAPIPVYAHVPMILGADGKRLSKREGAASVLQYRDEGYLPEAVLNYLVRLGWSHGDQELFSRDEIIKTFDLSNIHKSPAALNPQKLLWLNQHYIKEIPPKELAPLLKAQYELLGIAVENGPNVSDVVLALRERAKTLQEMAKNSQYFYCDVLTFDAQAIAKHITPQSIQILQAICTALATITQWEETMIHQIMNQIAAQFEVKLGLVAQPLRIAVTGNIVSPPIDITLRLLGQVKTLRRIEYALSIFQNIEQ